MRAFFIACAVCGGQGGLNSQAFVDTMVFLTVIPLMMFGAAGYGLWKVSQGPDRSKPAGPG